MPKAADPKAIIKRIKTQEIESEKGNITYRLTKTVVENFKRACEKQGVGQGRVIEEFMKDFIASSRGER